jgi:hypothetical protein
MSGRRQSALVAALVAAGILAAAGSGGGRHALAADEAILPLEQHAAGDAHALAADHAGELRRLQAEFEPCAGRLDVQRHGLAFRRPQSQPAAAPHLTLWVWVDPGRSPAGGSLVERAAGVFGRQGRALFARLLARSPVFADPRVGGYGLILTWLSPAQRGGRLVGESLAIFADKLAAANFVHQTIAAATFLARADVRAFDGQTELTSPSLAIDDADAPPSC